MTSTNSNHDPINAASHIVSALEFDLAGEQASLAAFGKTETPVTILPPLPFDLAQPQQELQQTNCLPKNKASE